MTRCDFYSIMQIITQYISDAKAPSQTELTYLLFNQFAMEHDDFDFDQGRVNRWLKGKDAVSFKSYAKLFFSTNELPLVLSERSNGFFRRVMVLTMDQRPERARADFLDVLQGEADYFLHLCVDALVRMYADGKIHESPASIEAVKSLRNDSDSVQAFLSANIDRSDDGRIKKKDLYTGYETFCRDADRQSLTKQNFYRSMRSKGIGEIKTGGVEYYKGIIWKENLPFSSPEISLTDWSGLPDSRNPFTQGWRREKSGRL